MVFSNGTNFALTTRDICQCLVATRIVGEGEVQQASHLVAKDQRAAEHPTTHRTAQPK